MMFGEEDYFDAFEAANVLEAAANKLERAVDAGEADIRLRWGKRRLKLHLAEKKRANADMKAAAARNRLREAIRRDRLKREQEQVWRDHARISPEY